MDADEKLKMGHADIILGISEEARAKVMESDMKSARCMYKLKATRDEGVRLLECLKHMMDSQIIESQAAVLNRQKKIDELEAQLQEAEDVVTDLRGELRQVQDELKRVIKTKNSGIPQMNEYSIQSNGCGKCWCSKMVCKETGLYRNIERERILRACDRKSLDRDLNIRVKDKERGSKDMLCRFDSVPRKKRSAIRQRKTSIPLAGTKSHLSKDNERNLVEAVKDRNTVHEDNVKVGFREKDFKITFQRKRKRQEAPSELEADASLQAGKKMRDGKTASPQTEKSEKAGDYNYKPEEIKQSLSAHESRQLALVARQLLALSKSKW